MYTTAAVAAVVADSKLHVPVGVENFVIVSVVVFVAAFVAHSDLESVDMNKWMWLPAAAPQPSDIDFGC